MLIAFKICFIMPHHYFTNIDPKLSQTSSLLSRSGLEITKKIVPDFTNQKKNRHEIVHEKNRTRFFWSKMNFDLLF